MQRIAILGAGVTGLVIANRLSMDGHKVEIIEAQGRLGGNQKSFDIGPFTFDIGTFIFPSFSPFFTEFPGIWDLYHRIDYRPVRLTPKGNLHTYPFDLRAYLREQGLLGSLLSFAGLPASKLLNLRKRNVPEFARYYVGGRIYEESGLRFYIERLFGLRDVDIDVTFARKRMADIANVSSLRNIFRRTVLRHGQSFHFEWAIRPRGGFDVVFDAIRHQLQDQGVEFRLNTELSRIEPIGSTFRLYGSGFENEYDRVISTAPPAVLARLLGMTPGDEFPALRLYSLFYSHSGDLGFDNGTFYNFTPTGLWKRITVLSRYYGQAQGRDYFTVEITLDRDSSLGVEDVRKDFESHIRSFGFMRGELTLEGYEETRNAYPVYRVGQRDRIEEAKRRLTETGVEVAGRQGQFDYIPSAALATEKATGYLEHGRWIE